MVRGVCLYTCGSDAELEWFTSRHNEICGCVNDGTVFDDVLGWQVLFVLCTRYDAIVVVAVCCIILQQVSRPNVQGMVCIMNPLPRCCLVVCSTIERYLGVAAGRK